MDTLIDFPLKGLNMEQYVNSEEQKMSMDLTYDCFAVSNHMGGTGGGHYTAYAKCPLSEDWFSYNDSSVSRLNPSEVEDRVVSSSAYSLFYRRRDTSIDLNNIQFDMIKQLPHTQFLEEVEKKRKAQETKK